jgi:RNA recognition motif-containing protein
MDIFVGNLHPQIDEDHLRLLFEPFGTVISTNIVKDKDTGLSRGFGFVKFEEDSDALEAIKDMNDRELAGKALIVKEAKPKEERPRSWHQGDEDNLNHYPKAKTQIDGNGWASVEFDKSNYQMEKIDLEVKDEAKFSKEVLKNGFVQIRFKK